MGALGEPPLGEMFSPAPPGDGKGTTEQRVLRSTLASYAIQLARIGINFGAKLALIRLILPEGHGVYELALRIVTIASAVRDLGLPYQLVRDKRRPYGTVLAVTTALGALLTFVLIVAAPLFGRLSPEVPSVLRVFAVWVLLDGLAGVPRAFFERELTIGNLVAPEIGRGIVIATVAVGLAWLGWGYWSLVIGDLVGAALLAGYSWSRAWGKITLRFEPSLISDLVRRSFLLFLIWLALQLVTYIDIYIVDWFRDTQTVGLYSRAYWLVFLVATFFYPRALFPTLVEYQDDQDRFLEFFRLSTVQLLGCQVLGSYFVLVNASRIIFALFGRGWSAAVPMLQVLAFIPFFDQFAMVGGEMLKARHQDRAWLSAMVLNLISLVGVGIFLTKRWGAPGMAAANYLLVGNLVILWHLRKIMGSRFKSFLVDLFFLYSAPFPIFLAVVWFFPSGSWSRLVGSIVAGILSFGLFALRFSSAFWTFFRQRRESWPSRESGSQLGEDA